MKKYFKIVSNKYFLTSIAFLLLMLFFDQNDWFSQRARQKNLNAINANIEYLTAETNKMEAELRELNSNSYKLEKYAREKYHQKKDNEDVYIIKVDSSKEEKK